MAQEWRNDTRDKLVSSFKQLVIGRGFDKLTVRDITDAAGVSRSTFYLYFKDKYDVIEYIFNREIGAREGGKPIYAMDFQNDGEFVGGCIAGGRNYLHINANGDVEPCVFIHYSGANIRECTLLQALKQPLFMAYRDGQPFNGNHLRPCPMLENPELLREMVARSGAHGTDEESEESVEHLCAKCDNYAKEWAPVADDIWAHQEHHKKAYENYAKENL